MEAITMTGIMGGILMFDAAKANSLLSRKLTARKIAITV